MYIKKRILKKNKLTDLYLKYKVAKQVFSILFTSDLSIAFISQISSH